MTETVAIDERAEAKALSPSIAWPTLLFIAVLWSIHGALLWVGLNGLAPLWLLVPVLAFVSYSHYTYVHEAIHGNILPRGRINRFIQDCLGWVGSLSLFANWPLLSRTHKGHHSHTNTERDPDIFVKLPLPLLAVRILATMVFLILPMALLKLVIRDRSLARGYINADTIMTKKEKFGHYLSNWLMVGTVWTLIFTGYAREVMFFWYIPSVYGYAILSFFLQWIPHYPFDSADRYMTSRNVGHSWLNPIMMMQNWHLMHHLWPSVPFYNYQKLHARLEPVLEAKGARHNDGFLPRHGKVQRGAPIPVAAE